jgi:uncharacterized coiled-coil DUF342 family protein
MNGQPAGEKDQYAELLEQLQKVQAAMRACARAVKEARSRAWEWRAKRDELHPVDSSLRDQLAEERGKRDELNAEVARLKRLRNEEVERSRTLREEWEALRKSLGDPRDAASLEDLQQRYQALEWQQQTTSTSIDEERVMLAEMERLTQAIEQAATVNPHPKGRAEDAEKLWQEIQASRTRAQQYHEQMTTLVEEAQRKHQSILNLSQARGPNQTEEQDAHRQYVQCLQEADEMRDRLEELGQQEANLKKQLEEQKSRRVADRAERERRALEKLAEQARAKRQAGQKLTMQELRALMETTGLD